MDIDLLGSFSQILNIPLGVVALGIFTGYAIIFTFLKGDEMIGGKEGKVIFSPFLGLLLATLIFYSTAAVLKIINVILATEYNFSESLTSMFLITIFFALFYFRIKTGKPLIQCEWAKVWIVALCMPIIFFELRRNPLSMVSSKSILCTKHFSVISLN